MKEEINYDKHCANLRMWFYKIRSWQKAQNVEWKLDVTGVLEKDELMNIRSKSHDGCVCLCH